MNATATERWPWERTLRDHPECVGARLLVGLTLGTHMQNGLGSPSVETLARQTGLHRATIFRHLRWLFDHNLIATAVPGRRGRSTVRALTLPADHIEAVGVAPARPEQAVGVAAARPEQAVGVAAARPEQAVGVAPGRPPSVREEEVPLQRAGSGLVDAVTGRLDARLRGNTAGQRRAINAGVADRLRNGWDPDALVDEANRLPPGLRVDYAPGFFQSHVAAHPPSEHRAVDPRPAWCESPSCDKGSRMRDRDDGLVERCPVCHPLSVAAAS